MSVFSVYDQPLDNEIVADPDHVLKQLFTFIIFTARMGIHALISLMGYDNIGETDGLLGFSMRW